MGQMEKRLGADKPGPKSSVAASRDHCPRWIMQLDKPWRVTRTNYGQQKKNKKSNQNNNKKQIKKRRRNSMKNLGFVGQYVGPTALAVVES